MHLLKGLLASAVVIAASHGRSDGIDEDNYHDLTKQSCMGARALIDLDHGHPAHFCKEFYRERDLLPK